MEKKHIYIIGSKGIPARYGGFETFVEQLTKNQISKDIQYHIACMTENSIKSGITGEKFIHNGAECFNINVPDIGPAKAVYYDVAALSYAIKEAKENEYKKPIFYILACRIGPFINRAKKEIEKIDGKLYVNPDGHEWLRAKWSYPIRKYWKISEQLMVKYADLLICDSKNIEKYIQKDYKKYLPRTTYIAYGTDLAKTKLDQNSKEVLRWYSDKRISENNYYLVVGRFVPENNYETMIREFMKTDIKRDMVLITNVEKNKFYEKLRIETKFDQDPRIKFVGTVYNQELLKYIRENAYAYIHGHEVGGTNPSLLEALASSKLSLLFDIGFNREVGEDGALYWSKKIGSLSNVLENVDVNFENYRDLSIIGKRRMSCSYTWNYVTQEYEKTFLR